MKNFKINKIIGIVLTLLSIISVSFCVYEISLLANIETFYRTMGAILLIVLLITLVYSLVDGFRYNKNKKLVISSILTILLSIISLAMGLVINKVYTTLDNMNSNDVAYKTVLVSLKDLGNVENLKDIKIGLITNEEDINGYILPMEVMEKYSLDKNNEIVKISDNITLMSKLLNNEVDAIFISSNYKSMFQSLDNYEETTTFYEITTYGKNYKKSEVEKDITSNKTEISEPFTILLLGIDSYEEEIGDGGSYNGDTIMLLAVDPSTLDVTMFSIPRDTYTYMACGGALTKINHAAWGGTNCMIKTVEKFTGLKVDYYAMINFKGVGKLVDAVGGVDVDVPVEFCETNAIHGGQICLKPGYQHLNGDEALAFSRHRKTLPLGDFQRGQHQQLVVEALVSRVKSLRSVNDFLNVLDTVSKSIKTNMSTEEMLSLYNVAKNALTQSDTVQLNITKTFLTGYSLYIWLNGNYSYTFQYYKQSLDEIIDALKVTLGQKERKVIKEFTFSIKKPYEKYVAGDKYYNEAQRPVMADLTKLGLSAAKAWAEANGLNVNIEYVDTNEYSNGTIISQSIHEDELLELASKNLTLKVASNSNVVNEEQGESLLEEVLPIN